MRKCGQSLILGHIGLDIPNYLLLIKMRCKTSYPSLTLLKNRSVVLCGIIAKLGD